MLRRIYHFVKDLVKLFQVCLNEIVFGDCSDYSQLVEGDPKTIVLLDENWPRVAPRMVGQSILPG